MLTALLRLRMAAAVGRRRHLGFAVAAIGVLVVLALISRREVTTATGASSPASAPRATPVATVAAPPPVEHEVKVPCERFSQWWGTLLSKEDRARLREDLACEAVHNTNTSLDCMIAVSSWEDVVSKAYLKEPASRPVENEVRQRYTETFLTAWAHYFGQCVQKPSSVPAVYAQEKEELEKELSQAPSSSTGRLRHFAWDGVRFAVGENFCWKPHTSTKDPLHQAFFRVAKPNDEVPPLAQEDRDERGLLSAPRLTSRFMRNPVLWRAWGIEDRLYNLTGVMRVEDPQKFLEEHTPPAEWSKSPAWVAGAAWSQHSAHATEAIMSVFAAQELVPALSPGALLLLETKFPNTALGPHHIIRAYVEAIGRATKADWQGNLEMLPLSVQKQPYVCFPRIAFAGYAFLPRCNGRFLNVAAAARLRSHLYEVVLKEAQPPPLASSLTHLTVFLLDRGASVRNMNNAEAVRMALEEQTFGEVKVKVIKKTLDEPLADQIRLIQQTDVVVAPHGQGLLNFVWMRPHSGAVEVFARNWHTTDFGNPIVGSGSYYAAFKALDSIEGETNNCCRTCCASSMEGQMSFNALLEGCNLSIQCPVHLDIPRFLTVFRKVAERVIQHKYK